MDYIIHYVSILTGHGLLFNELYYIIRTPYTGQIHSMHLCRCRKSRRSSQETNTTKSSESQELSTEDSQVHYSFVLIACRWQIMKKKKRRFKSHRRSASSEAEEEEEEEEEEEDEDEESAPEPPSKIAKVS